MEERRNYWKNNKIIPEQGWKGILENETHKLEEISMTEKIREEA